VDEAPASDDAHAPQDDSAPAEDTAEEFSTGNGHESSYAYLPGDAHIYNQDSLYTDSGSFDEPTRPPFDDLPSASFDQPAAPPPPGDDLTGTAFGSGVTVGRPESGFSGSTPGADAPDGEFSGSAAGGVPDGGYGGGFTGSGFTGSAYTGSPAVPDLHDGGFSGAAAGAGGSDPAGSSPYTAHYSPGYSESPAPTGPEIATQSTQRTGTYPYPPPPTPASPPARGRQQSTSSARRANLIVARLEPWSVMKFSFLISLVAWIVLFVAVALLYYALSSLGVFASLQKTLASVTSSQGSAGVDLSKWTSGTRVMGYTMLLGAVDVVLITALSTLGAVVYNLVTHLGGGIEITLKETE